MNPNSESLEKELQSIQKTNKVKELELLSQNDSTLTKKNEDLSDFTKPSEAIKLLGDPLEETPPNSFFQTEHRYTVLKELGEGGMGVVQLVRDELLGREVALKKIHFKKIISQKKEKHLLWRLQREAEIMARLDHPNIVPLYEIQAKSDEGLQFTMKKVEGKTLRSLLEEEKESSSQERNYLEILLRVCDGIRFAHARGVIHRDLKPDNIMVGNYGEVYILDWGIAKKIKETPTENPSSTSIEFASGEEYKTFGGIGTMGYMSPEQQRSATDVDERSDIYALGKILRECYIKLSPWQEVKALQHYFQSIKLKTQTPKSSIVADLEAKIPQEIKAIIHKATAKEHFERYPTVESFAIDIGNYLKNIPVSAQEYRLDQLLQKWAKRHQKKLTLVGCLLFLMMLFWGYWLWKNEKEYQASKEEAKEKMNLALSLQKTQMRKEREQQIKTLLQSLNAINQALRYKHGKYESEAIKIEIVKKILPLCYQEEDYQLASFIIDDLRTMVHFSEKKYFLTQQLEEKKIELLHQHLARLEEWKKKYHALETKNQIQAGDREDFLFEISKMEEEEILERLLQWLGEGVEILIQEKNISIFQKQFYEDIIKILRRLGNKKANDVLRSYLQKLWKHLLPFTFSREETFVLELREGKIPESLQQKLLALLTVENPLKEQRYYLKKISQNQWEYINEEQDVFFTFTFTEGEQRLRIYKTSKKKNIEYLQWIKEIMTSLAYLEDKDSVDILIDIHLNPDILCRIDSILQKMLNKIHLREPQNLSECIQRGLVEESKENWEDALKYFTKAIEFDPQLATSYFNRGAIQQKMQQTQEGIKDIDEAIRLNPRFDQAYNMRGIMKSESGDTEGSIIDFTESIRLNPHFAQAYYNRGTSKIRKNDFEGAIHDFTECIRLNPQFIMAYQNRGVARSKRGDFKGAIADYNEALHLEPQSAVTYHNRGNMKHTLQDFDGAIDDFTQAIQLDPQYKNAYNGRGFAKKEKKDIRGAIDDFTQAIQLDPQYAKAYYNRGNLKQEKKDFIGALKDYNQAIQLDPQFGQAYNNRGAIKRLLQDFDGAIDDFTQLIQLQPELSEPYNNRGATKYLKKDLIGALEDFTKAIQLAPNSLDAYRNRGVIREEMLNYSGAASDFTEILRINPKHDYAYYARGNLRMKMNNLEMALSDFTEAIRLNPHFSDPYNNRGIVRREKGDFHGAIEDFNEAIRLNPQYIDAYFNRGILKQMQKNFESSIADFTEVIRLNPRLHLAYYTRGNSKKEFGDLEGAIEDFEKSLSIQPNVEVQVLLINTLKQQGREYFTKKDWKKAKENLLKLKKYLPANDPQQKQLQQKLQQLESLLQKIK